MKSLVHSIVLLVATVALFLIVLGALLWGWNLTVSHQSAHGSEFLVPSQTHLARAQRSLVELKASLYQKSVSAEPDAAIPYRFRLAGMLDDLERQLVEIVRLAYAVDYREAFNLPSRAHKQFETARTALLAVDEMTFPSASPALAILGRLQDTLSQLERVYELDKQRWLAAQTQLAERSLMLFMLAAGLLTLLVVPLILRLARSLRDTVRRESKARQDLEEATQSLEVLAMYDSLTGLGNRNLFKARLEQALESARRTGRVAALMYIDLDNFKRINDSIGHDAGDEVLKIMAGRLGLSSRASDTVARIGGDEFVVVLTEMASERSAATVATKLLQQIKGPMNVHGTELVVSASIGITMIPNDGSDSSVLMKNADMALYKAKEHGRNNFQFFVEEMNRAMVAQMAMESALRAAISAGDFKLHYQPQVDLRSGQVSYVEALLRWPQADGSMISPDAFIPIAESTGLLTELGGWVVKQACKDLARLRHKGMPDLKVSINFSAGQFREPNLIARIEQALRASALPPSALEVEITETTLIEDIDRTVETLDALRELGVTIAIDDFGIGYSSLNYLKHLPIDALKIDRSFVRDIEVDEADRSIVDAVLAMARTLSLRVVAEGIESKWQLDYLASKRCDEGQGFLFSRPVAVNELRMVDMSREWSSSLAPPKSPDLQVVE